MPKVDLHHHLDGAFRLGSLYAEAKRRELPQGKLSFEEFKAKAQLSPDCRSLTEFLATFHFFYDIAQNINFLKSSAEEIVYDLQDDKVLYTETRFAPHLFATEAESVEKIVKAVLEGLNKGKEKTGIDVNLILCVMRGNPASDAHEVYELAQQFKNQGVVGIDLAGDESRFSGREYISAFQEAKRNNIPITIHAGEAAGPQSVYQAIDDFKAQRIGHGIHSIEDAKLIDILKDREIMLEICLTSNLQTGTVAKLKKHPLKDFLQSELKVSINTDDPSVSDINLSHEYTLAQQLFALDNDALKLIARESINAAFCSAEDKKRLIAQGNLG